MRNDSLRLVAIVAAVLVALAAGTQLQAQAVRGTIQGAVTDPSGAALPGVTVEAKNLGTGVVQTTITNSEGRYTAPDLGLGDYEVQATLAGFQTVIRRGITLRVGSQALVDFQLPVGNLQESITVTGAAPMVDTVSSALGAVVEQKQIADLPLNGRNFSQLISLAPGANEIPFGAGGGNAFFGRQNNFTVSGARPEGQAFLLDNTNIQGFWNRGPGSGVFGTTLGVEAIAEFQTLTNTYSAQFGGNGAVVNAVTKSGTNQNHGSVFEYYRNSKMDARNFFDTLGKPPFKRHQFGGSIGGPVKENKAFYFFTYEGIQQERSETRIATVPDANARLGIVNGVNVGVNPAIAPVLPLYPLPTTPLAGGVGQVSQVGSSPGHENYLLGRMDYTLSQKTSVFGRYALDTAKVFDAFAGSNILGWGADQKTNNQYFTTEVRRIVSNDIINQSRLGVVRTHENAFTSQAAPVLNFFPGEDRQNGVVNAGSGISGIGGQTTLPVDQVQKRYTVADDVYLNKGSHSIKLGASAEWTNSVMDQPFQGAGVWTFPSLTAFLTNAPTQFIGATPNNADSLRSVKEIGFVAYVNDDWRATSKLTLNLGLRYNPMTNPAIEGGPGGPKQITDYPQGAFVVVDHAFAKNPSLKNWDPRLGFAFDPLESHKLSVRGGFGVFHNPVGPRIVLPNYVNNPPYIFANEVVTANGAPRFPTPYSSGGTPAINVANGIDYLLESEPSIMQWNVNIQRELMQSTSITAGYVGSRGRNLLKQVDVNPVKPSVVNGVTVYGVPRGAAAGLLSNPRQNPLYAGLTYNQANTWSEYHSLQTSFNRRFSNGVQSQVSYTLSKCTDLSSGSFGGEGSTPATNPYDVDYDEGPCYFDRTHNLRASGIVALPFGDNPIYGGWELSTIVSAVSGRPFTPAIGFDQSGLQTGNQRPNLASGRDINDVIIGTVNQWFDPTAFTLPAAGTLGTVGRHSLRGPKYVNVDLSAIKNVRVQGTQLQFRLEAFNLLNRANFNLPTANVFTAAPNGGGTYSATAGRITSALPARQLQVAMKVNF
jgi:hypothetical protein